jgi:hypothetical protein
MLLLLKEGEKRKEKRADGALIRLHMITEIGTGRIILLALFILDGNS